MMTLNAHILGSAVYVDFESKKTKDKMYGGMSTHPPKANANWKKDTAAEPAGPKQWCITPVYESRPLNLALMTTSRIVLLSVNGRGSLCSPVCERC